MTQLCTFTLGELQFGVETRHVQEVIRQTDMTSVPLAPGAVRGLINLRGQIVTVIDLGQRLELPGREDATPSVHVVALVGGDAVSLLVDAVGDVVEVTDASFERPPGTLDGWVRELIVGVHKLDGRLVLVLDVGRVTEVAPAWAG